MIRVVISGPAPKVADLAKHVKQIASSSGQVVRHYINFEPEAPVPQCDLVLVEKPENPQP